jgi:sec-independent protein translocase protein TatA
MGNFGTTEIILILVLFLVFFGAKKIPELAQGLGKGIREFRKAAKDIQEDVERDTPRIEEKGRTGEQKG